MTVSREKQKSDNKGENMIFIVGKPRSGTTWLLSLLSDHPRCCRISMEMLGLPTTKPTLETGLFVRNLAHDDIQKRISTLPVDRILVEKTPSHLFKVSEIKELLPAARIILIRRQYLDVIFSMIQKNDFWHGGRPTGLDGAIDMVIDYHKYELKYENCFTAIVEYEELWAKPVSVLRSLLLQLDLTESCADSLVEANSHGRKLPDELKGVFRKGEPGQGLSSFTFAQRAYIKKRITEGCAGFTS